MRQSRYGRSPLASPAVVVSAQVESELVGYQSQTELTLHPWVEEGGLKSLIRATYEPALRTYFTSGPNKPVLDNYSWMTAHRLPV